MSDRHHHTCSPRLSCMPDAQCIAVQACIRKYSCPLVQVFVIERILSQTDGESNMLRNALFKK